MKKPMPCLLINGILLCNISFLQAMTMTTKKLKQLPRVAYTKVQQPKYVSQKPIFEEPVIIPKDWRLYLQPKELQNQSWLSQLVSKINSFLYGQKIALVVVPGLDEFIGQLKEILYGNDFDKVEKLKEKIRLFSFDNLDKKQVILYVAALINSYSDWLKVQGQFFEVDRTNNSIIALLADFIEYMYLLENPTSEEWQKFLEEHSFLKVLSSQLQLFAEFGRYHQKYADEKIEDLLGLRPGISYEFIKNKYDQIMERYSTEKIMYAVRNGSMSLREANIRLAWIESLKNVWQRYYSTIPQEERNRYEYGQEQLKYQQKAELQFPVKYEYASSSQDIHLLLGNVPRDASPAQIKEKYYEFMKENHPDKIRDLSLSEQIKRADKTKEVTQAMHRYEDARKHAASMKE